jgi:hypothetical protein
MTIVARRERKRMSWMEALDASVTVVGVECACSCEERDHRGLGPGEVTTTLSELGY